MIPISGKSLASNEVSQPLSNSNSPSLARLKESARDFEASMMKELLVPLQHRADEDDSGGDDSKSSNGALTDFANEAMAKCLADQGGFGIAKSIVQYFEKNKGMK